MKKGISFERWLFYAVSLLLLISFLCMSYDYRVEHRKPKTAQIMNVVGIFMNTPCEYTFLVLTDTVHETAVLQSIILSEDGGKIEFAKDVPKNKPRWVFYTYQRNPIVAKKVTVHVREFDDIQGGGYNHGKFGSGTYQKILKTSEKNQTD